MKGPGPTRAAILTDNGAGLKARGHNGKKALDVAFDGGSDKLFDVLIQ